MHDGGSARGAADPLHVTKELVLGPWDRAVFGLLSVFGLVAIAGFFVAWFATGWGQHPLVFGLLTAMLTVVIVNRQGRWFLLPPMRRPVPMSAPPGLRVAVVTTYVPVAESVEMLEASLKALVAIDYPHDTWLLDEGGDTETAALCGRLGVRHFSRTGRSEYQADGGSFQSASKHGNYNAWLQEVGFGQYDFLVAFDPDHLPLPSFLSQTLGYFRDPNVGYVQAAQAFYNQRISLVARGAAEETYAYFSVVLMAAYGMDYPIIIGSHNSHRMAALQAVGGFAAHDADDLLLTLRYRASGWEGVYVPRILARGLTPVDWRGYLGQQRRWARSVIDIKLRHRRPYSGKLPLRSRVMSFLHGINYLHRSLVFLGIVSVLVYLLANHDTLDVLSRRMVVPAIVLGAALELQDIYRQRFFLDWRSERGLHWRVGVLDFAKWPWILLALGDVLLARRIRYLVTAKAGRSEIFWQFTVWNLFLASVVAAAWTAGGARRPANTALELVAGVIVLTSLALAWSGLRTPPRPYEPGFWRPSDAPAGPALRQAGTRAEMAK